MKAVAGVGWVGLREVILHTKSPLLKDVLNTFFTFKSEMRLLVSWLLSFSKNPVNAYQASNHYH